MNYPQYEYKRESGHRNFPNTSEGETSYMQSDICRGNKVRKDAQIIRYGYPKYIQYGECENPFGDGTVVENAVKTIIDE